jgi:bifunctional lysine-specific demethylase and histidyl-hydroxylase NO66
MYAPLRPHERLPQTSNRIAKGLYDATPVLDVVLEPGDLLYVPRGWICQASTLPLDKTRNADETMDQQNSLHLTVAAKQQKALTDLMEVLLPEPQEAAISGEATNTRQGLRGPLGSMRDNREENVPRLLQQRSKPAGEKAKDMESDSRPQQEVLRAQAKHRIVRDATEAVNMPDATSGGGKLWKRFLLNVIAKSV